MYTHRRCPTSLSVKKIWKSSFDGCYSLELMEIKGEMDAVMRSTFRRCLNLRDIDPDKTLYIEEGAFKNTLRVKTKQQRWVIHLASLRKF